MQEDLFSILGEISMEGCFSHDYWKWEDNIAIPRMKELGYTNIHFYTEDGDSFGPLVRGVHCIDKNGEKREFFYG